MASNTPLNSGSGGDTIVTKERTHDGDAAKQQGVFLSGVTGSEGAYTFTDVQAGGGTEAGALRVTVASDSTGVLSVDDNGGSITVDNGGTFAVQATVAAAATNIAKAEDAASADGDVGVPALAVRKATPANTSGADGDYEFLQMSAGRLWASATIDTALPAGTNAIGKLAANSGVDIGDIDVTSIIPGTGATNLGKAEDAAAASGDTGVAFLTVRQDTLASSTSADGDYAHAKSSSTGAVYVNVAEGGISGQVNDAALTIGTTQGVPIMGRASAAAPTDVSADNDSVHAWMLRSGAQVTQPSYAGVLATTGNGASGTGVQRVTLANDSTGVLATVSTVTTVTNITNQGQIVDDAAFTPATTRVMMAGFTADESSTDSVDEGDGGAARMTLDRKVIVTPYVHSAAGGQTPLYNLDVDESEDAIKASAGKLFWIHVMNLSASLRYIKFYDDTVANVVVGTTTPKLVFPIPTLATTNGAGFCVNFGDTGVAFANAITVAATTGLADNNTGAPGANEVVLNCGYA